MRHPRPTPILLTLLVCLSPIARGFAAGPVPGVYDEAIKVLDRYIAAEVADQKLPALSIALVDDQSIVWSQGYGMADPRLGRVATADTVYRVGSVSKLFTDIALMQLVEAGKVDIDAPVPQILPDFAPKNPFGGPITLRQLMAHRSGLVRESPRGSYFDEKSPSIADTIASLNGTSLVYRPGDRLKYSNAGITVVGQALETIDKRPFADSVKDRVLKPLGMVRSDFDQSPVIRDNLAVATMWTEHGREFTAPTFAMGIAPAGSLYSTVGDLGKFLQAIFAGGKGANGPILKASTLDQMTTVQFARENETRGFGLGFSVGQFQKHKRIGHGGAVYGFATELSALPSEKLGVVVIASRDCGNGSTTRIADAALTLMLAVRHGEPPFERTTKPLLAPETARKWAGLYRSKDESFELTELAGRLWFRPGQGGSRVELRASGDDLVGEDLISTGPKLTPIGEKLQIGKAVYERVPSETPPPAPVAHHLGLIGEYGWDHNTLYILEKQGRLFALIEWFFLYPLKEESADVYAFPESGLYQSEKLIFHRDGSGRSTGVVAASVLFPRRSLDGEDGRTFRIKPVRPIAEIRRETADAKPPVESGKLRPPDLVDLGSVVPDLKLDIRYASSNNFLGEPLYSSARALMERPAAEALKRVQARLADRGLGLLIHDAYRPWKVTRLFWEATPVAQRTFVADPAQGSKHNRGCAVDLTLCDRTTGRPIEMPGGYDEFSDRSYPDYPGGPARQRWYRDLLRRSMESEGFTVNEAEWWHFDFKDWREYPIIDTPFEDLATAPGPK